MISSRACSRTAAPCMCRPTVSRWRVTRWRWPISRKRGGRPSAVSLDAARTAGAIARSPTFSRACSASVRRRPGTKKRKPIPALPGPFPLCAGRAIPAGRIFLPAPAPKRPIPAQSMTQYRPAPSHRPTAENAPAEPQVAAAAPRSRSAGQTRAPVQPATHYVLAAVTPNDIINRAAIGSGCPRRRSRIPPPGARKRLRRSAATASRAVPGDHRHIGPSWRQGYGRRVASGFAWRPTAGAAAARQADGLARCRARPPSRPIPPSRQR